MGLQATLVEPPAAMPGDVATCRITLRNTAVADDRFRVEVAGEAAAWASVRPAVLDLAGGTEGVADILLAVPRSFRLGAGAVVLEVQVRSRNDPARPVLVHGLLHIAAFTDVAARLQPTTSHARRSAPHVVTLHNRGNVPVRAGVTAVAAHASLTVDVDTPSLTADPGRSATAVVVVRCRRPRLWGEGPLHRFEVVVSPAGWRPIALAGELRQQPLVSGVRAGIAVAAAVVLASVVVAVVLLLA